jgi:hypothetical protein
VSRRRLETRTTQSIFSIALFFGIASASRWPSVGSEEVRGGKLLLQAPSSTSLSCPGYISVPTVAGEKCRTVSGILHICKEVGVLGRNELRLISKPQQFANMPE